jgi:hypothetical protein
MSKMSFAADWTRVSFSKLVGRAAEQQVSLLIEVAGLD